MADKILVVDDESESLRLIGLTLHRQGYEVIPATTGQQALEKAATIVPDLIVLDVMMPGMDGIEVCRRLKSTPALKQIPVIMFTAKAMVDDKVAGFEAGADDYLTKPVHPNELVARVKTLLGRRQPAASLSSSTSQRTVIGFIGAKGGVGLTTLALNMAIAFQRKGPTILAELRPGQGNIGALVGADRTSALTNLLSRQPTEINAQMLATELVSHASGLRLLMSSSIAREAQTQANPDTLVSLIKVMRNLSRTTLIDMGPALTRLNTRLLREIDWLVVVAEPTKTALLLARELLKEVKTSNPGTNLSFVLVNRTASNTQVPWQESEQAVGQEVMALLSAAPDLVFQAAAVGQPLIAVQPNAVLSTQISKLTDDLDAKIRATMRPEVPPSPSASAPSAASAPNAASAPSAPSAASTPTVTGTTAATSTPSVPTTATITGTTGAPGSSAPGTPSTPQTSTT